MKKILFFVLAASVFVACLAGCGGGKNVDIAALAQDIMAGNVFEDIVSKIDGESAPSFARSLFGLSGDEFDDCVLYRSTLATPEEIALFKARDKAQADRIVEAVNTRIALQKDSYQSYAPEKVPMLDNAIVKTSGLYVFFVCADKSAEAESIINGYLK